MITPEYIVEMASYNEWQNQQVYDLCSGLAEEERSRDCGMFFRSVHDTLDHILLIDEMILEFLDTGIPSGRSLARVHQNFESLRAARATTDELLVRLGTGTTTEWLASTLDFWSDQLGRERRIPRALMVVQMFNHQTHHRSQVTSQLHALGLDYGCTDLPFAPKSRH